jgi:hypothetical protein
MADEIARDLPGYKSTSDLSIDEMRQRLFDHFSGSSSEISPTRKVTGAE